MIKEAHLKALRNNYQSRLQVLEIKEARLGVDTPPHIILEIKDLTEKIQAIDLQLRASQGEIPSLIVKPTPVQKNLKKRALTERGLQIAGVSLFIAVLALARDYFDITFPFPTSSAGSIGVASVTVVPVTPVLPGLSGEPIPGNTTRPASSLTQTSRNVSDCSLVLNRVERRDDYTLRLYFTFMNKSQIDNYQITLSSSKSYVAHDKDIYRVTRFDTGSINFAETIDKATDQRDATLDMWVEFNVPSVVQLSTFTIYLVTHRQPSDEIPEWDPFVVNITSAGEKLFSTPASGIGEPTHNLPLTRF